MDRFHLILEVLVLMTVLFIALLIFYFGRKIFSQKEINLSPFLEMIDVYSPFLTVFRDRTGEIIKDPLLEAKWANGLKQRSFSLNELTENSVLKKVEDLYDEKRGIHYRFVLLHPKRTLEIFSVPVYDASSKFYGAIDFVLDISSQSILENDVLRLTKNLDFCNRAINDSMSDQFSEKDFKHLAQRISFLFECDFTHVWYTDKQSSRQVDFLPLTLCKPFSINAKNNDSYSNGFLELIQKVLITHEPLLVERTLLEEKAFPFQWQGTRRNLWILPIISQDSDRIGIVVMANITEHLSFNKGNVKLIASIVAMVITVIENKKNERIFCHSKQEELQRLANLMDNLPGVIFTCQKRPLWHMLFLSQGIFELSGYSVEDLVGKKGAFEQLIFAEDRANIARKIDVGLAQNNSFQLTFRLSTKNNGLKWIWVRGKTKGYNSFGGMLLEGIMIDVTQQIEADSLAQNQQLFINKMVEALPFQINVVNSDGYLQNSHVLSSEKHKHFFSDQFTGLHIQDIVESTDVANIQHSIQHVIKSGGVLDVETRILPLNPPRWFESRMVKIGANEALVFSRDITERKQADAKVIESELLFRSLFDIGNIAMGIINRDGTFAQINSKFSQLLELNEIAIHDLHWSQIIIPEEQDYDNLIFSKLENGKLSSYQSEKRFVKSDGSVVYTHFTLFLLKNEYLQSFKFVVSFIDISDRMNLERRVLSTMIDTEEKERMRMARDLHDGVGPLLSSLKMYLQWMQMKDSKANKEELIGDAQILVDQTLQTIRDISFNLSPHLLQNYGLTVALESFIGKVNGGDVKFHFRPNKMIGRIGEEYEVIMYRAMTECINNTLKYANAKNVHIEFDVNGSVFYASYRDDGIGFDPEEVLARRSGMGLFNMQSRLKAVNGNVRFKSAVGFGCHIELEVNI